MTLGMAQGGGMTMPAGSVVTLELPEADYRYGQGSITIRVERVDRANPVRYDGESWYWVQGAEIGWNDIELGRREVLVRGRRLPAALSGSSPDADPTGEPA